MSWQFIVENVEPLRADSIQYVYGTWSGEVPLSFDPPKVGFALADSETPAGWTVSSWVTPAGYTRTCAVEVGPGTAVGILPAGRWYVVADLVAGVESPRLCGGSIRISPGDGTGEPIVNPVLQLTPDPDHDGYLFVTGGNLVQDSDGYLVVAP